MTFEVNTVSTRTLEVVQDEAENLNRLIIQRETWLADPLNRDKSNYDEVNRDTRKLIFDLKELQDEIQDLKKL